MRHLIEHARNIANSNVVRTDDAAAAAERQGAMARVLDNEFRRNAIEKLQGMQRAMAESPASASLGAGPHAATAEQMDEETNAGATQLAPHSESTVATQINT